MEFRPGLDKIKNISDTWIYKNCQFHFSGAKQEKSCPADMPIAQCYVYNGGICCAGHKCPGKVCM